MKRLTRLNIGPVAVLAVLVLLLYLAVHNRGLTAKEAEDETVGTAVQVEEMAVRDEFATVAFVGLMALIAFVLWTVLRAKEGEDEATPPGREPGARDRAAFR